MKILILMFMVFLFGCSGGEGKRNSSVEKKPDKAKPLSVENDTQRFTVTSFGKFNAGYDNHVREMLVIKDNKTGKSYFTVTGCGVTEIFEETSTSVDINGNVTQDSNTVEE